jgi:hypothetical protein
VVTLYISDLSACLLTPSNSYIAEIVLLHTLSTFHDINHRTLLWIPCPAPPATHLSCVPVCIQPRHSLRGFISLSASMIAIWTHQCFFEYHLLLPKTLWVILLIPFYLLCKVIFYTVILSPQSLGHLLDDLTPHSVPSLFQGNQKQCPE